MSDKELTLEDVLSEVRSIKLASGHALTYAGAAVFLGVSESTVRRMSKQPGFPPRREIQTDDKGHSVKRFVASELSDWLESNPISRAS